MFCMVLNIIKYIDLMSLAPYQVKCLPLAGARLPWTIVAVPGAESTYIVSNQFNASLKDPGNVQVMRHVQGTDDMVALSTVTLPKVPYIYI